MHEPIDHAFLVKHLELQAMIDSTASPTSRLMIARHEADKRGRVHRAVARTIHPASIRRKLKRIIKGR